MPNIAELMNSTVGDIPTPSEAPEGTYEVKLRNGSSKEDGESFKVFLAFELVASQDDPALKVEEFKDMLVSWSEKSFDNQIDELHRFRSLHRVPEGVKFGDMLNNGELNGKHYIVKWVSRAGKGASAGKTFWEVRNIRAA